MDTIARAPTLELAPGMMPRKGISFLSVSCWSPGPCACAQAYMSANTITGTLNVLPLANLLVTCAPSAQAAATRLGLVILQP